MATFGADHREVVQDVNAGRVERPPAKATTTSQGIEGGRATTIIGKKQNNLGKALMNATGAAASAWLKEDQRLDEQRGHAAAAEADGYERIKEKENFLNDIFGPSATMRGAQRRILEDGVAKRGLEIDEDIRLRDYQTEPDKFQDRIEQEFQSELDRFEGDEEMQLALKEQWADQSKKLIETQVIQHNTFVQKESFIADQTTLVRSSEQFTADTLSLDPKRITAGKKRIADTLDKVMSGRTIQAQRNLITGAVMTELNDGRSELYEAAWARGDIQNLDQANKNKVDQALMIHEQYNSAQFRDSRSTLVDAVKNGDMDTFSNLIDHFQNRYPGAIKDKNAMIDELELNAEIKAKEHAIKVDAQYMYAGGDANFNRHKIADRQAGMDMFFKDKADTWIRANRGTDLGPVSEKERRHYYKTQAADYAKQWAKGDLVSPQVQTALRNTLSLSKQEEFTPDQAEELRSGLRNYAVLRSENDMLAAKHMSTSQSAELDSFYQRVIAQDEDPRAVAKDIKDARERERSGEVIEPVDIETTNSAVESIMDDFRDAKGERPWYFFGRKDIEGEAQTERLIRARFTEQYNKHGNAELAALEAKASIMKSGTVIGNQFVANGAVLEKAAVGDVNEFVTGWMESETFQRDAIDNYGFPENFMDAEAIVPKSNFFTADTPGIQYSPQPDGRIAITTIAPNGVRSRPYYLTMPKSQDDFVPEEESKLSTSLTNAKDRLKQVGTKLWKIGDWGELSKPE